MSPPMTRYNPNQFEKTFAHKLEGMNVQDLDEMRQTREDRIREIQSLYTNVEAKSINVHERIT